MIDRVRQKTDEIASLLFSHIEDGRIFSETDAGLYSGKMGILFFLAHYLSDHKTPENEILVEKYAENYFGDLSNGLTIHTFCRGLSGIMAGLRYLHRRGLMEIDYSDIESNYEGYLYQAMNKDFRNLHFDFMHGGLGVALYFNRDKRFIEATVDWLERAAIMDGDKLKWEFGLGVDQGMGYNIALSHGMSGLVLILCRMHQAGYQTDRIASLITGAVNYMFSQQIDHAVYGCFFPGQSLENNGTTITKSRLGWCYGDLGIAAALWQAGQILNMKEWQDKALQVMSFTASRRDPNSNYIRDCGICHGSAGVAMIFDYMHRETNEPLFLETRDYWISVTLDMARFPDGYAGYKIFSAAGDSQWKNGYHLLEGVAGIGLVLWSMDKGQPQREWTDLFLL